MSDEIRTRRPSAALLILTAVLSILVIITSTAAEPSYILGADISWIPEREASGVKYAHNGQVKDIFDILKENKFNYIRLRLFVDPTAKNPSVQNDASGWNPYPYSAGGYCGLESTVKMAKRVKAAGMGFLLDFHYSDTWADPSKQYKPMSWQNLNSTQLIEKVRSYTKESLEAFKAAGALPDMVQVGNEVVNGMIHPDGSGNNANFAKLVNAGIKGVKEVDPNIKIVIHTITRNGSSGGENASSWVSTLTKNLNGVETGAANKIDIIGLSYYPKWHGDLTVLKNALNNIAGQGYNVIVAEYADVHREVNDAAFAVKDKKGLGTFVWEPEEFNGDDSKPLFDWKNNRRETNSLIALYPKMASDYKIEDVGVTTGINTIRINNKSINNDINIRHNGIIAYNSKVPGVIKFYGINGKTVGKIKVTTPGLYDPSHLLTSSLKSGAYILSIESNDGKKLLVSNVIVRK